MPDSRSPSKGTDFDQDEFNRIIPEYDALVIGAHPFPEEVMEKM